MFKNVTINLTAPICDCPVQNLHWAIGSNKEGRHHLTVSCGTCKTELTVPHGKFLAHFHLDVPYPGAKPAVKAKPNLEVLEGGQVIPLKKDDSDPN